VIIVETKRTVVDSITLDDAPFFLALVNSPDWLRYIGIRHIANVHDACRYLEEGFLKSYSDNGFGYYVIRTTLDRVPIGTCGFLKRADLDNPDFGFALLPEFYGQGFAIESCRAVLDYGIRTFDFNILDAITSPDNLRSIKLLDKLGFSIHGEVDGDSAEKQLNLYRWQKLV
jgi:RimJ/RimL family protein N-acetyltransferase